MPHFLTIFIPEKSHVISYPEFPGCVEFSLTKKKYYKVKKKKKVACLVSPILIRVGFKYFNLIKKAKSTKTDCNF